MKRIMQMILCFVVCLIVLVGCGSKQDSIVGKWTAVSLSSQGEEMDFKDIGEEGFITAEFKENHTYVLNYNGVGNINIPEGKWEEKDSHYILTVSNSDVKLDAMIKGGQLRVSVDHEEIIFEKDK